MTNELKEVLRSLGKADAIELRNRAESMDGTHIIREEIKVPNFDPKKDYTLWPVGSPVADEDQVWQLLQPYNAANYEGRPSDLRALWSLCHTKDPDRAKPWVDAFGTSGMYMENEVYKDKNGKVWKCLFNNTTHNAEALPTSWEDVTP